MELEVAMVKVVEVVEAREGRNDGVENKNWMRIL